MCAKDFLQELRNGLIGKIKSADIDEIISDYTDIFNAGVEEGKSEDSVEDSISM